MKEQEYRDLKTSKKEKEPSGTQRWTVTNEILDLFNFTALINDLIKCNNDKLNVCYSVCQLPTVSHVCVTISGLCKLTVIADKQVTVQSTVVTKTCLSLISCCTIHKLSVLRAWECDADLERCEKIGQPKPC